MDSTKIIFIVLIITFSIAIILSFVQVFKNIATRKEVQDKIIFPEKYSGIIAQSKKNKPKEKKKRFFLIRMYKEYIFFFGNGKKLLITGSLGYFIMVVLMFLLTKDILFSCIMAISFLAVLYTRTDNQITKKRKRYIKDFASAISVLSMSTEAGNTFEAGIKQIVDRDTIGPKIRAEFANINNDLKNNVPLEDALENFYERNKTYQEIGMFVIIIQFYSKKGGDGLKDILYDLSSSLQNKITAYAEMEAELGIYTVLMNFFVYGYFIIWLIIQLFMPTFYANLFDYGMQYTQAIGSVFLYAFGIWFYKSMMRGTAEG